MRSSENARSRFNRGRFFHVGSHTDLVPGWYAETREGFCGPFTNREAAEQLLDAHIQSNPRKRVSNWHLDEMALAKS